MATKKPQVQATDMFLPAEAVYLDMDAFDACISAHGVTMEHFRHIPCPLGLTDLYIDGSHHDHDCSNGFIYDKVGEITGYFNNNATVTSFEDFGIVDGSTAVYTLPRSYDASDEEVLVQPRDRLFFKDFKGTVLTSERFEHSIGGPDRLKFKAVKVHSLMDSSGTKYKQDRDFLVSDGQIKWIGDSRPAFDPSIQKGQICSISYSYLPYYYIEKMLHDTRIFKDVDEFTGTISTIRQHQQVLLAREHLFQNEPNNDKSPSDRDFKAPRKRSFGPR